MDFTPPLSKRLERIVSLIDPGTECLADIGTDHGMVPVYAVKRGLCSRAVASDLRSGPLKRASLNISLSGLRDKIDVVCAPGMQGITVPADCVIIAGMGGMLINDILREGISEGKIFPDQIFILSAHTQEHKLRTFLAENGFRTVLECAEEEEGHIYLIIKCIFDGISREITPEDAYCGYVSVLPPSYYENVRKRLSIRTAGLCSASELSEEEQKELVILEKAVRRLAGLGG